MSMLRPDVNDLLERTVDMSAFEGRDICVVVPDRTRPIDYAAEVVPLVERLAAVATSSTLLCGIGLHRPMSNEELGPLQSLAAEGATRLLQHDAHADDSVRLADDVSGGRPGWPNLPAEFHPAVAEADVIVSVGVVEPHQYAGFSGGAKGVSIGCASHRTIGAMHGLEFLRKKGTRLGAVEENPFRNAIDRLADPLPELYGLQIVPSSDELERHYAFGPIDEAFRAAVEEARERFFLSLPESADWFHLPVPAEKATNFYQASRAATYAALAEHPAIREGGTLVVEAACPEGVGTGSGEAACAEALGRGRSALLEELRSDRTVETRGGEQRAYVVALALDRCDIALVGAPEMAPVASIGIRQFETFDEAAANLNLEGRGRSIEDIFHSVPVLSPGSD